MSQHVRCWCAHRQQYYEDVASTHTSKDPLHQLPPAIAVGIMLPGITHQSASTGDDDAFKVHIDHATADLANCAQLAEVLDAADYDGQVKSITDCIPNSSSA